MENKTEIYIGPKSSSRTCPVCMRTKEVAIAEQLQTGKSCGHERCEFKSEMELVFAILNAPDIEQIKSLTCESVETSKKTYELLVSLRESVRVLKSDPGSKIHDDEDKNDKFHSESFKEYNIKAFEGKSGQLKDIYDRIDKSTRALSELIEMKKERRNDNFACQPTEDYNIDQALQDLQASAERSAKNRLEWDEYLKSREIFNRQMEAAWAKVDNALKGMREVVEEMKEESNQIDN